MCTLILFQDFNDFWNLLGKLKLHQAAHAIPHSLK